MSRHIAAVPILIALVLPVALPAQRLQALRSGISTQRDTTLSPPANIFAPPPSDRFKTAAVYIGLVSAFAAGSLALSDTHPCDGCRLAEATLGAAIGSGVGAKVAATMLRCEHRNADAREALATILAGGTALMLGRSNIRTGEVAAIVGLPLTTAYFIGGCEKR